MPLRLQPHSQAHKRVEIQQTNQHPPKTATCSPCGGKVDRLFQVNMAVFAMFQNTRIFKRYQVLLLNRDQLTTYLFGSLHIGKTDHNQIAHKRLLNCLKLGDAEAQCQALRRLERGRPLLGAGG